MPIRSATTKLRQARSSVDVPKSRRERQIVRVLKLLKALGEARPITIQELAAEFHTRRETIYRDLRVLQDAGYPITGDERGRLSRPRLASPRPPTVQFSAPELEVLLSVTSQAQPVVLNSEALSSAKVKLITLAKSGPHHLADGSGRILETWICGEKEYQQHGARIALLVEAILRKRRCHVAYRKPSASQAKTYDFDPYSLLFVGGGLYVIGRVTRHTGTATLAIDRFHSVVLSSVTFRVPSDFDPKIRRLEAFGVSSDDPIEVVLRFRSDQAPYVRERIWHPSQRITELPDGSVQLAFRAGGSFEISRWVLGWGDAVEVISPPALREEIGSVLKSALSPYRN
jgi:proteasome accessory factor B